MVKKVQKLRPSVMAVFLNSEGKVLIGSSPRNGGFKFPQGGLEPDEGIFEGLKRELNEELGVNIFKKDVLKIYDKKVSYLYVKKNSNGFLGQEQTVCKIQYNDKMKLVPQDDEFGELVWIFPKDLEKYDTRHRKEAYLDALKICGLL